MARPRKPIAVLEAEGKSHMTKDQIQERKDTELKVPFVDVRPPEYLTTKKQKEEFQNYSDMLAALGIFTELDVDCLAQYVLAKELYEMYTKQLRKIASKGSVVHKWAVVDELAELCDEDGTIEDLKKLLEKLIRRQRGDDMASIMSLQDKAFKQCLACAKELGMTITSRCRIVVPPPPDNDDDEL